jgi:hypothetical protein
MKKRLTKNAAAVPAVVRLVGVHRIEYVLEVKLWVSIAALKALEAAGIDAGGQVRRFAPYDDADCAYRAARWRKPCAVGVKPPAWLARWMLDAPAQREITFTIIPERWENIKRTAAMIGVSAEELCLASIGHAAMLEMIKPSGAGGSAPELVPPEAVIHFALTVPASVIADLGSFEGSSYPLAAQVAECCFTRGGSRIGQVSARWTTGNCRMGCKWPLAAMAAKLDADLAAGAAAAVLPVPLTTAAAADLARIASHLGIAPEEWLRGVVGALAIRGAKWRVAMDRRARIEARAQKREGKP